MPKSGKNARPYNKVEKILAKGEKARQMSQKHLSKTKGTGGSLSAAERQQVKRDVAAKIDKINSKVAKKTTKNGKLAPAFRAGDDLSRGKTFEKGKKTKVRGALSGYSYAPLSVKGKGPKVSK